MADYADYDDYYGINFASFHPIQHCDVPEGSHRVLLTMLCKSSQGLFLKILRALADVPDGWGILAVGSSTVARGFTANDNLTYQIIPMIYHLQSPEA